jgi:hypothetical protein
MAFLPRRPQIPRCTDLAGKRGYRLARAGRRSLAPLPRWCLMLAGEPGVWAVDTLSGEDQRMLWPDEICPQEIGALAVLDGGLAGQDGGVRVEAVREVIAARLRLVPWFPATAVRAAARAGPTAVGRRPGLRPRRSCEGGPGPGSR